MNTKEITNNELNTLEIEIIELKNQTAQNMIKIGLKLIDAKKLASHGEWGNWLSERVGFSQRTANNFMRIGKEFSSNSQAISNLDATKLYLLTELSVEEREKFINQNDLKTMSTREMKKSLQEHKRNGQDIWNVVDKTFDDNTYDISIDELKPFPNHENYFWDMKGKNYLDFLNSIQTSGVVTPIIITRDNMIISGHQRVRACKDLGIDIIPVNYLHSENKQNRKLDDLLLSAFISCNMHTRSCVFYLACAWQNLYFGGADKVDYYMQKFIECDNSELDEWLDEAREKLNKIENRGI